MEKLGIQNQPGQAQTVCLNRPAVKSPDHTHDGISDDGIAMKRLDLPVL
jgi:hypothetical protein